MAINSNYEVVGLDGKIILKTADIKEARKADKVVAASQSILDIIKDGLPEDHAIPENHLISIAQHIIEKKQEIADLLKSFREGKKKDDAPESGDNSAGEDGVNSTNNDENESHDAEKQQGSDDEPDGDKEPSGE